ncbi:MAG: heme-binding protein [Planctomycetota bacterium]
MNATPAFVLATLAILAATADLVGQAKPVPPGEAQAQPTEAVDAKAKPKAKAKAKDAAPGGAVEGQGAVRTPKLVRRVGGDREIAIDVVKGVYRCGPSMIESPLPEGYPEPTPPGAIDIKDYPSVRRAELVSKDDSAEGMTAGFFPLFNHIKKREIAMTAPVEMDYAELFKDFMNGEAADEGEATETTMSFLYRSANLGPVGKDGKIVVRDTAPVTVLSVGAKGAFDATEAMDTLRAWLKGQQEWEVAAQPRMFVYNGPFIDPDARWSEVQVPIRRRGKAGEADPAAAPTTPVPATPAPAGSGKSASGKSAGKPASGK